VYYIIERARLNGEREREREKKRERRPLSLERERFLLEEEVFLVFLTFVFYWSQKSRREGR
jgi:hypothetical protein